MISKETQYQLILLHQEKSCQWRCSYSDYKIHLAFQKFHYRLQFNDVFPLQNYSQRKYHKQST